MQGATRFRASRRILFRLCACAVLSLAPPAMAGTACGLVPAANPVAASGSLAFKGSKSAVTVNKVVNDIPGGSHDSNRGINPDTGAVVTTNPANYPGLDPSTFPVFSSTKSVDMDDDDSLAAGTWNKITADKRSDITFTGGTYYIKNVDLKNDTTLRLGAGTYYFENFSANKRFELILTGKVRIFIRESIDFKDSGDLNKVAENVGNLSIFLYPGASFLAGKSMLMYGLLYGDVGSEIEFKAKADLHGAAISKGKVEFGKDADIYYDTGTEAAIAATSTCSSAPPTLHHVRINHSGTGLTCTPSIVTVNACSTADVGGICTAHTTGISGNVTASAGSQSVSVAFTIPSGSSSVNVSVPVTTVQTATLNTSLSGTTCWNGSAGNCNHSFADSGFVIDAPDHIAGTAQNITIGAVKKSDSSLACVPGFASVTKSIIFSCSYGNPSTGTKGITMGSSSFLCNGSSSATVDVLFNSSGVGGATITYPDAGQVTLSASHNAASPVMTGSAPFVAVPQRFVFSTSSSALQAGVTFSRTVTAVNSAGVTTLNFGKEAIPESASLSFTKCQPSDSKAVSGSFTGTLPLFSNGAATGTNLKWSEVGTGDMTATLQTKDAAGNVIGTKYLSSNLSVAGTTSGSGTACSGSNSAALGPFAPAYFETALAPPPLYTYSGQPISTLTVTAKNGDGNTTSNYASFASGTSFTRQVTLSAQQDTGTINPATVGTLSAATILASAFKPTSPGTAIAAPVYTFTNPAGLGPNLAPLPIKLRATEDAPGTATSSGHIEASTQIRLGRLRLFNIYGGSKQDLDVHVHAQYWTGSSWLVNGDDNLSAIPASAVALTANVITGSAVISAPVLAGGKGFIKLSKPDQATNKGKGYVDLAVNLGSTAADQSCLAAHPATVGAALPWLRWLNGSCAATYDRDPSARASFGVFAPETRATVYVRERFD